MVKHNLVTEIFLAQRCHPWDPSVMASRLGGLTAQDLSNGVIYEIDQYVHHTYDLQMYSLIPSFEAAFNVAGLSRTSTADIAGYFIAAAFWFILCT